MNAVFTERRKAIMEGKAPCTMVVIYSGKAPMRSADEEYDFAVDRNFYYLTGIDRENMILVLKKGGDGIVREELYIERFDEVMAKWVGARMLPEEAREISGIDQICYLEEWAEKLNGFMNQTRGFGETRVYLDLWKYKESQSHTEAHLCAAMLREKYPSAAIYDIYVDMAKKRMIKSSDEVELLRKAQGYTKKAVEEMMRYVKPGMSECELEGAFDFALRKQGVKEHAFPSIVAAGKRATILHYRDNNLQIEDGDLVLVDLGSACEHYCSDISRTFPANGKFTERQKECYNVVLEAMDLVIAKARAGMTLRELNQIVIDLYTIRLEELGLLKNGKTVGDYYYHGVSHHVGLDTHDILAQGKAKLEPGMVITVEPGLYIEDESIGIRIENDILITENEAIDLSKDIIKTVEEIENWMQQ